MESLRVERSDREERMFEFFFKYLNLDRAGLLLQFQSLKIDFEHLETLWTPKTMQQPISSSKRPTKWSLLQGLTLNLKLDLKMAVVVGQWSLFIIQITIPLGHYSKTLANANSE